MKPPIVLPSIPAAERTPLVETLLSLIEGLAQRVKKQEEDIAQLKDEIRALKGQKGPPRFKPSKMDEKTEPHQGQQGKDQRRPGSEKRSKNAELVIHDEQIIALAMPIPEAARFKGYRDVVIQDLIIRAHNTR